MLKYSLAAGLLACAALTPVAFAQDKQAASGGGNIQFIQTIDEQQFRGSELMGQTVYNNEDEAIGDIGDALVDKSGRISAVVIDVGGFLGIGAREVGVPFNALRFEPAEDQVASGSGSAGTDAATGRAASSEGGAPPTAGNSSTASGNATQNQSGSGTAGTPGSGSMGAGSANTGTGSAAQNAAQGESSSAMGRQVDSANQSSQEATSQSTLDNVRIVLNTSREELQNAPELKTPAEQSQESGAGGGSGYGASGSGASGSGGGAPAK